MGHSSEGRLADVFEMLISRMDTIETSLDALHTELAVQKTAQRYDDSRRPLGTPFSGMPHCGLCMELTVYTHFDCDGVFRDLMAGGILVVTSYVAMTDSFSCVCCLVSSCDPDDHTKEPFFPEQLKVNADLRAAWGDTNYEHVRSKMMAFYKDDGDRDDPTWDDLEQGFDVGRPLDVNTDIHEAVLRQRLPGLVAIGPAGVAVEGCSLKGVVDIMRAAWSYDERTATAEAMEIHMVPPHLKRLALAVLRNTGKEAAWLGLSPGTRRALLGGGSTFLTRDVLAAIQAM